VADFKRGAGRVHETPAVGVNPEKRGLGLPEWRGIVRCTDTSWAYYLFYLLWHFDADGFTHLEPQLVFYRSLDLATSHDS
jgi:hypothetical protein